MSKTIFIGGRLESKEKGNVVAGANAILDDTKGKKQNVINKETDDELLRLEQSKQDNLTFDNAPTEDSTNPVTSGGVYTAEKALSDAIEAILLLIPSAATALNKLVDTNTMNSSISTATATFRGTYNAVSDLGLTYQATHAQIEAALDALGLTADNNDYAFVQVPVSDQSQDIAKTERYKNNGTNWQYEYDLNTSGFTAAQWAAINSGITVALVTKLTDLPTAAALQLALNAKQDMLTFDTEPTALSQNPVTSGGIYTAIQAIATALSDYSTTTDDRLGVLEGLIPSEAASNNKLTDKAYVDGLIQAITELIPAEATTSNQLADKAYVLASILAATPAFKGQFTTLAELQAVASPKAGDLGIVRTKDSDGMDVFTVYQYLNNAWGVFYSLSYHPQTKPATTGTTGDYPYNGMGRVKLSKNIVNGVNTLTQDMFYKGAVGSRVPNTNTIFVICYDYVLAENITIPDNCVLEFEGGSVSGAYTITGNNTGINADFVKIFNSNITFAGTWNVDIVDVRWFGIIADDNTLDCTPILQKIIPLNKQIHFPKGTFYLSSLHIVNTRADYFHIEGEPASSVYPVTIFKPFTSTQSYIIKCGGPADKLSPTNQMAFNINIINIGFKSDISYNPTNLTCEYTGTADYYHGALILDRVEVGHFAIYGSGLCNTPLLVIDYSYECKFDFITVYGFAGKNDLPVIYMISSQQREVSATYIHRMECEVICAGPVLKTSSLAACAEFIIDNFMMEGTVTWEQDIKFDTEPDWSTLNKIPIFEIYNNCCIVVNHLSLTMMNIKYDNPYDAQENKNTKTLLKTDNLISGYVYLLDTHNCGRCKYLYIDCNGSAVYKNTVTINADTNIAICQDKNFNNVVLSLNGCIANEAPALIPDYKYSVEDMKALYNPADVENIGVDSQFEKSKIKINNLETYKDVHRVKHLNGRDTYILNKNGFVVDTDYIVIGLFAPNDNYNNWRELKIVYLDEDGNVLSSVSREDRFYGQKVYNYIIKVDKSINYSRIALMYAHSGYDLYVLFITATNYIDEFVNRSGTFADKPSGDLVGVGFKYFCTDKQTTEGATNGIEIFHKGGDVWVDALGRTVS